MKKIFYILLFFSLCFAFKFQVNAEEIDCNSNEYACVKCTYKGTYFDIKFIVYSNGNVLNLDTVKTKNQTITGDIDYNVTSNNFKKDNELFCPSKLYFTQTSSGRTQNFKLTFDFKDSDKLNVANISLYKEENNNKTVFNEAKDILSCNYKTNIGNISIESDGETFWFNSGDITILTHDITINDFLDNNGNLLGKNNCPNLYFVCTNRNGKYCSIYNKSVGQGTSVEGNSNVSGEDIVDFETGKEDEVSNVSTCNTSSYSPNTCAYYLGNAEDNDESCPAYWLNYVFQIVKYASIILVIVMDTIDLATAVAKEGIEPKLIKKCVMRLVICIIILLLPTLINSIGALFGLDGLLCGIK